MTKSIMIDGIEYISKGSETSSPAETLKGLPYVICRTYSAGVFAGYLKSQKDKEVVLLNARRIWYWDGAASLSQLAMEGSSKPENCKFPQEVDEVKLLEAVEILSCTEKARINIASVPIWRQDK